MKKEYIVGEDMHAKKPAAAGCYLASDLANIPDFQREELHNTRKALQ